MQTEYLLYGLAHDESRAYMETLLIASTDPEQIERGCVMMDNIFLLLLAMFGFVGLLCLGGLIAWVCGCDLNEPEYYEYKKRKQK